MHNTQEDEEESDEDLSENSEEEDDESMESGDESEEGSDEESSENGELPVIVQQNPPYDDSAVKADIENIQRRMKSMYEYIDSNVSTLHKAINEYKLVVQA